MRIWPPRRAYYSAPGSAERAAGMDFLWFLWAAATAPFSAATA